MARRTVAGMVPSIGAVFFYLARRLRGRMELELEVIALRHQLAVPRRRRPGRPWLFHSDRLLGVWLYRVWPRCLDAMILVKPAAPANAFADRSLPHHIRLSNFLRFGVTDYV